MLLDFNNLSSEQKLSIDQLFVEFQDDFEKLIKNIFTNNKHDNVDLLFCNIVSRNNDENPIFYNICLIELSLRLFKEGKINKIITSNNEQKKILKEKIKGIKIISKENKNFLFINNTINFFKNILYLIKLRINRDLKRKKKIKGLKNILLTEIFFIPNMFAEQNYEDRYYGNFSEIIKEKKNLNLVFFPIFFQQAINKNFIKLAEKKINLILQSDFLKIEDYIKSLFFFKRIKRLNLDKINFRNFNVTSLVKYELKNSRFNQSSVIALLNYFCFKRMKEEDLDIKICIDWYENQIVDKGFNYAKNIFFPDVKSKGYLGSNPILEVNRNFIPSSLEISKNVTPNEICLINPKYFELFKEFRKDIKFSLVPALRSQKMFDEKNFQNISRKFESVKILINFTGFHSDNLEMIELINNCKIFKSKKIDLFLRPHKAYKKEIFRKLLSKEIFFKFSVNNFYDEMKNTQILVSRPNTACFESLIFGVPVLITRRKRSFIPIKASKAFPKNLWFFCNDSNDLDENINRIIVDKSNYIVKSADERKKILSEYFSSVNNQNVSNLIN